MSQPPAPPQYSPDGRYWWDGTKWSVVHAPAKVWSPPPETFAAKPAGLRGGALIVAIVVVLVGVGGTGATILAGMQKPTPAPTPVLFVSPPPDTPTPSPTPACQPKPCAVNSGGMVVYVTGVTWAAAPTSRFIPADGLELVRVALTFRNYGSETESVNPLDFKLRDANGIERGYFIYEDSFEDASIAAGGTISGTVSFAAAPNTHAGVLIWEEGFFSPKYFYLPLS